MIILTKKKREWKSQSIWIHLRYVPQQNNCFNTFFTNHFSRPMNRKSLLIDVWLEINQLLCIAQLLISYRPYKCDQCVKEYAKSKHLARHRRTHLEKERCNQCNEVFSSYADHMLKKHGIELPRPFQCDICRRTYRTKNHISTHMRIHRAESRTFVCAICMKSFYLNTDLRKHMRTHSQDRSFVCHVCGAAFKSPDTLKCHMRRHTGDRPYKW